ncbi:MAG: hypothetical protein J6Y08_01435 [Clostridiales bacterium]|nr:hypothetical protein [Clostridiales bacterium]
MGLHVSKKSVLAVTGALLLAIGASAVTVSAKMSKRRMEKEMDEKLYRRIQKYLAINRYAGLITNNLISEDLKQYQKYSQEETGFYYVLEGLELKEENPVFTVTPVDFSVRLKFDEETGSLTIEDTSKSSDEGMHMIVVTDTDGESMIIWNNHLNMPVSGYAYNLYYMNTGDSDSSNLIGMNPESKRDNDMKAVAEEVFAENTTGGWHEEYRYAIVTTSSYMDETGHYTTIDELPYAEPDETKPSGQMIQQSKLLFFEDGSAEMKAWRTNTLYTSLIALAAWVVVMVVLGVLLKLSDKKITVASAFESGADKTVSPDRIPENLAKNLLDQIDQNETSLGPNGYLDQMRDLIQSHMSDSDK